MFADFEADSGSKELDLRRTQDDYDIPERVKQGWAVEMGVTTRFASAVGPFAAVSVEGSVGEDIHPTTKGGAGGQAFSDLQYDCGIFVEKTPPAFVALEPMAIVYRLQVASGFVPEEGFATAIAKIRIRGGADNLLLTDSASIGLFGADPTSPDHNKKEEVRFDLFPINTTHLIGLTAECKFNAGRGDHITGDPATSGSCTATADPSIRFDQKTFDEMMGNQTFPLDEFFGLEFSPGIVQVPEPSRLSLLGIAGLLPVVFR